MVWSPGQVFGVAVWVTDTAHGCGWPSERVTAVNGPPSTGIDSDCSVEPMRLSIKPVRSWCPVLAGAPLAGI